MFHNDHVVAFTKTFSAYEGRSGTNAPPYHIAVKTRKNCGYFTGELFLIMERNFV